MKTHKRLAIFKPGRFTALSGQTFAFSEADLKATAAAYDPDKHEAPLVVGHPKTDAPAYGWTASLNFKNGFLQATPHRVGTEFSEWVNAGHYGKVSAAFYPPDSPSNPVPGVYYLRHIGFLGAQPPAVKGLPVPQFSDNNTIEHFVFADGEDFIAIEFAEENAMTTAEQQAFAERETAVAAREAQLAEREATFAEQDTDLKQQQASLQEQARLANQRQLVEFCETLVKKGCLLPKDKVPAVEFMASLSDSVEIEFGEGADKKKVAAIAWFKSFLSELPKRIEFAEITAPGEPPEQSVQFASPAGYVVDADGMVNHQKIIHYQQQHQCDQATAIRALNL